MPVDQTVPLNGRIEIPVEFRPTTLARTSATLTVITDDPERPTMSVVLTARCTETTAPDTSTSTTDLTQVGMVTGTATFSDVHAGLKSATMMVRRAGTAAWNTSFPLTLDSPQTWIYDPQSTGTT